jgi:hypothetical protein
MTPFPSLRVIFGLVACLTATGAARATEPVWRSDHARLAGGVVSGRSTGLLAQGGLRVYEGAWIEVQGSGTLGSALGHRSGAAILWGEGRLSYRIPLDAFALGPHAGARRHEILWTERPYDPIDYRRVVPAFGVELEHRWERFLLAVDVTLVPTVYRQTDYTTRRVLDDGTAWFTFVSITVGTSLS